MAEYGGQSSVTVVATGLGSRWSERRRREILAEWIEFFRSGPSPISSLVLWCRTPKRLFDALGGQTQLRALRVKWGDYDDLSVLQGMHELVSLRLGGASRVSDLTPLQRLVVLEELMLEDLRGTVALDAVGALSGVTDLELGGDWASSRRVHVPDLGFLRSLPQLRRLVLHTMIVDDADYSPLLSLPNLVDVRVAKARTMRPSYEELQARLPWSR